MDDHFNRILSTDELTSSYSSNSSNSSNNSGEFIRSDSFQGGKEGYVFKRGPNGLGYYIDKYNTNKLQSNNNNNNNNTTTVSQLSLLLLHFSLLISSLLTSNILLTTHKLD